MRHMRVNSAFLIGFSAFFCAVGTEQSFADMTPIEDSALQAVTGQSGISLGLELDINVVDLNKDGNVDLNAGQFQPISGCGLGDFSSGIPDSCRLALSFANRPGEWLVLKDYYGSLRIDNLYLDGGYLSDAGSDPSTFDPTKFQDGSGNCLLGNGISCSNPNSGVGLANLPAMVVRLPGSFSGGGFTPTSYLPASPGSGGVSNGYDSLTVGLTIGGASIEYGATGYSQNNLGSFLGVKIADNNSPYAGADVQGSAYVFGF